MGKEKRALQNGRKACIIQSSQHRCAGVMELVDVLDSKSSAARRAGSSPATGTKRKRPPIGRPLSFWYFMCRTRTDGSIYRPLAAALLQGRLISAKPIPATLSLDENRRLDLLALRPSVSSGPEWAAAAQNRPGPAPGGSSHLTYAPPENRSAARCWYRQIFRRHSTICSSPH